MKCPYCGSDNDAVLDSRPMHEGEAIKRRRECKSCDRRFTTFETIEEMQVTVVNISEEMLQQITENVERTLTNRLDKEVPSSDIGEMVMDCLSRLDQVAYVRFASVYRQFEDATQFRDIVNLLKKQRGRDKKDELEKAPTPVSS
jgi:transcriptional repressor NrdR